MFVDASALTAILAREPDARGLLARMQSHAERIVSPLVIWETVIAVARILGLEPVAAEGAVKDFLKLVSISVVPVPIEAGPMALDAFARFGQGRHPAALDFGDCVAYACARHAGVPLLYQGHDFAQTDIEAA